MQPCFLTEEVALQQELTESCPEQSPAPAVPIPSCLFQKGQPGVQAELNDAGFQLGTQEALTFFPYYGNHSTSASWPSADSIAL